MNIISKLIPNSLSQFCGNKYSIKCIEDFIKQNNDNNTKQILCIVGPDGCGKTVLCKLLLKKYQYDILEIKPNDDIKVQIHNFSSNKTITSLLQKKPKAIFIDDIDILQSIDKLVLSKIINFDKVFKDKNIKVFITCNINEEKRIIDNSQFIEIFKISYPSYKDSYVYIMNVFDEHNIAYDTEQLLQIVLNSKGNIRETVLNLNISKEELEQRTQEKIFKDLNNFEISKQIFYKKVSNKDVDNYASGDIGTLPFVLYENIVDEMEVNYKISKNNYVDTYLQLNKYFTDAMKFESNAFTNCDWTFLEYANLIRMKSLQDTLEGYELKSNRKDVRYKYSQALSKLSHKNIMGKKIKSISTMANVSNSSVILATDMYVTEQIKQTRKSKKNKQTTKMYDFTEGQNIINIYDKYFT